MKAAVYNGPPDVIQIMGVEKPVPNDQEILIKVRAASVNPLDWHYMRGTPYLIRIVALALNRHVSHNAESLSLGGWSANRK